jgi:hypothetical protein
MRIASKRAWERPPADYVKVNCDATFVPHTGSGGWGCKLEALLEPLQGKIIACIQGMQATIDADVVQIIGFF